MIMQEWHAATTTRQVTHSRISSLLISRHLTRPRVASRYSVWASSVTESGRGNPKICGRTNPPLSICSFLNVEKGKRHTWQSLSTKVPVCTNLTSPNSAYQHTQSMQHIKRKES